MAKPTNNITFKTKQALKKLNLLVAKRHTNKGGEIPLHSSLHFFLATSLKGSCGVISNLNTHK